MKLFREYITYTHPLTNQKCAHYVIYAEGVKRYVASVVNVYLHEFTRHSKNTSNRYSRVILNFFVFLVSKKEVKPNQEHNFWLLADDNTLKMWQVERIINRDKTGGDRPSFKTVYDDAVIVHEFYSWAKKNSYQSSISIETKEWRANFKENDLLAYIYKESGKTVTNHKNIKVFKNPIQKTFEYNLVTVSQIKELLDAYTDPVYAALFKFSLSTGLRPEGCLKFPYKGFKENSHIGPWEEMKKDFEDQGVFSFYLVEKGKGRKAKVNVKDWNDIYLAYQPELLKRRKLYKEINDKECPLDIFWLTARGKPITPKMIADATTYAVKKLDFDCDFYQARHWYATMFMVQHLKNCKGEGVGYNAAVDEALRNQLGHQNISTTYKHYIKIAEFYIHIMQGNVSEVASEDGFLHLLSDKK